jgi:hypothetical protein
MTRDGLSADDLAQLREAGIGETEAARQLAQLRQPPLPARLLRAATPGDGVLRLDAVREAELRALGEAARNDGRLTKFVPASGAATRMFRALIAVRALRPGVTLAGLRELASGGDADARETVAFLDALPRLALARPLAEQLGLRAATDLPARFAHAAIEPLLGALLDSEGLDAARLPKALLPFHASPDGARSAFVEQLVEGVGYLADRVGLARFHFTVPPGGHEPFARALEEAGALLRPRARLAVAFSEQSSSTDTLALDAAGRLARTANGALLLRPSGHGALLGNLERTGGDLVLVKNIDNVLPEARHAAIAHWKLVLAGALVEAQRAPAEDAAAAPRPIRVCGVVPAAGEPGGGPFWVRHPDGGATLQIVEPSQVDLDDPAQREIWQSSTHFNPVDLACALRDDAGAAFSLSAFVDAGAAFVSTKFEGGRELRVLERPGLWNGSMAGWQTLFIEVPAETFAPVKTVLDLARPEHAAD